MVSSSGRTGGIAGSNKGSIPFTIANKVKSLGGCITIAYLYKLRLQGRWLNIVRESSSVKECLEKMGRPSGPGNYRTFYRLKILYDLDTSHFKQNGKKSEENTGKYVPLKEYLEKPAIAIKGSLLIKKLVKEGYKEYKCENPSCGISEWHGNPILLQIHHIDGNHYNNSIDKLSTKLKNFFENKKKFFIYLDIYYLQRK